MAQLQEDVVRGVHHVGDRPDPAGLEPAGEPHGLGLLMAEAVLSLEGCRCVSLGVQTPGWDIVRAAIALDAEVAAGRTRRPCAASGGGA